ncbi:FixH family protein [Ramlibacter sp. PS4R-6]|uniref:FixH family protein n=1 Tax=Ramlibacter sp. PS4R-6 TaxID=3133438 RepID=UPI0030A33004
MNGQDMNPAPWWQHGHVWLLIAGPAAVVVAGVLTAWIAVAKSDPVVDADYYRRGIEINKQLAAERALLPAVQGRNHAATPVKP